MARLERVAAEELSRDEAWWGIYADSFPAPEREPAEVILRSVRARTGLAVRARLDGRSVGLATTHLLRQPASVFLVYLAVERGLRGAGLGRELLDFAWTASAAELRSAGREPMGMIWEVDPLDESAIAAQPERSRRIAFFER